MFEIFGDSDREVTVEDTKRMQYTEMVIKESLRRFPVAIVLLRYVEEDIEPVSYTHLDVYKRQKTH